MIRLVIATLALAGCSPPLEQPSLQTYGSVFPACVVLCNSRVSTATLAEGATQSSSETTTKSVNNQP